MKIRLAAYSLALWAALTIPALGQIPPAQDRLGELERKIEVLAGEVERLRLGEAAEEPALISELGLGPAAAKIYKRAPKKVSIGGYGEMTYQNFRGRKQNGTTAGKADEVDFLRAVLYTGYKFNDWITFNSELEFEHASESKRGEVSVEMAALDFRLCKAFGVRTGMLLMPVGLVNEVHEPTTFHGVRRPNVESNIYPTTWRENGAGVFGELGPVEYRSYLVTGLQAVKDSGASPKVTGFSASSALRNGRSSGSKSLADDFAWVGRLDVKPWEGTVLGGSFYSGEADHEVVASVPVTLWDLHAKSEWKGLELRAIYAQGHVGNADTLNTAQTIAAGSNSSIGSDFFGGYLEAAFDLFSLRPTGEQYLAPFFRYERYDTQWGVPDGWTKNPSNSRVEYTFGLTYKPMSQVAVKADHQILRDQGLTGIGQTNLGIGYIF
jgi:hypothetical protein